MKNRIIDINEMYDECNAENCPNYGLRLNGIKTQCSNCVYDALLTKIETEKKAMANAEKNVCEICKSGGKRCKCNNCIYSGKKKIN